uniref:Bifunctional inhibitor/plant lipid transfer protein/seed storage helical domain-containing protein n=1 Tax=Picea sitchensis TaxID=3332 RepID=A9NRY4_PICSI|nr:unknown [Picea sitchensis]ABK25747.1 unknown [Picea sitchensis]
MANLRGFLFVSICLILAAASHVEADKCGNQIQGLLNKCSPILLGKSPSAACCGLIRSADMGCVCPKVTPQIAKQINVSKVVSVVKSCGRNVPHRTRCGSIVTP